MLSTVEGLIQWASLEPHRCQHWSAAHLFLVRISNDWEPLKPYADTVPSLPSREQGLLTVALEQAILAKPGTKLSLYALQREGETRSRWFVELHTPSLFMGAMKVDKVDALLDVYLQTL